VIVSRYVLQVHETLQGGRSRLLRLDLEGNIGRIYRFGFPACPFFSAAKELCSFLSRVTAPIRYTSEDKAF